MFQHVELLLSTVRIWDFLDILIVSLVFYNLYILVKDTRAASLIKGILVLAFATFVSNWLELHVIYWLLQKTMTVLLVALPIVFQPELRRALEQIGRGTFFSNFYYDIKDVEDILDALSDSAINMAKHKIGALIVIERETRLGDIIETGIEIDSLLSSELLINIFIPNTPLHDGAVVVRGNRIAAAACLLPLTDAKDLSKELGTRHRAAIGLSEQSDALILVVSEETGTISLASTGLLRRNLTSDDIKNVLRPIMISNVDESKNILRTFFRKWGRKR